MVCSFPPELTDEQMMMVLDGESSPDVRQHLTHCEHCRNRFEELYQFEILLRRKLRRRDCPTSYVLRDYELQLLPQSEHRDVADHIHQCPRCEAEIAELREFLQIEDWPQVPAVAAIAKRSRPNERLARMYQGEPVFAMRGGLGSETLLLETDGVMIFLEAQPEPLGATVMGRLLAADLASWTNALVELKQTDGTQTATIVDESGLFNCKLKSTASLSLWVTSQAGITLVVEDIKFET